MADCGANGSTLDRAAAMLQGASRNGNDASKHLSSLIGHSVGSQISQPMPIAAPDHIIMPSATATRAHSAHDAAASLLPPPSSHQTNHPAAQHTFMAHPTFAAPPLTQQQVHHHQMQMAAAVHHQQQQQSMMMMQQQQMNIMRQQQVMMQQQKAAAAAKHLSKQQQYQETPEEQAVNGHEGLVQGATIEDLAAAWAEAEADYHELEAAVNLASAVTNGGDTTEPIPYEFINTETQVPPEPKDWMGQGMRAFEDGNLKEAILAFEMELQHNNPDNSSAWRMLGRCHAENDQDREAIICLEHAVDRDPYSPEARLALGVSYVNELNHEKALENLKAWITHNPQLAGIEVQDDLYGEASADGGVESAFDEVQSLLLRALQHAPANAAEILEALGVVYNVSRDYDAAIDAFKKAIEVNPDDYQLYNRLGATLANCNKSEQALPAYRRALQLKPRYTRAWLNMAISHSNLQNYDEAARCYLQTLSLNPAAVHCWSYLRIALSCSERWDLIPHAASMDLAAFREHFNFVMYET